METFEQQCNQRNMFGNDELTWRTYARDDTATKVVAARVAHARLPLPAHFPVWIICTW